MSPILSYKIALFASRLIHWLLHNYMWCLGKGSTVPSNTRNWGTVPTKQQKDKLNETLAIPRWPKYQLLMAQSIRAAS